MSEPQPIVYANGLVELVESDRPHHLEVGGYPALLADHCELVDRVAMLEERLVCLYRQVAQHVLSELPDCTGEDHAE